MASENTFISDFSQQSFDVKQKIVLDGLRVGLKDYILSQNPHLLVSSPIAISELDSFRQQYLASYVLEEVGQLSKLEEDVLDALGKNSLVSDPNGIEPYDDLTFAQKVSDKVAGFGGSWTFIILFIGFMFVCILVNVFWLSNKALDPYPFILLNLMLSFVALLQAPVLMMSQNRQEEKDRDRAQQDYMINLKSELEIRILHEKIDHLAQF